MLKGDQGNIDYDISFFMNTTATRGGIVTFSTAGSGIALDQASAVVAYAADPSGKVPVGVLMCDVVDIDQSKYSINQYKDEVQKGGKVTLATKGWVVTNNIEAGDTPTAGAPAYVSNSGLFTSTNIGTVQTPRVGSFLSRKDEAGYAKVSFRLPY